MIQPESSSSPKAGRSAKPPLDQNLKSPNNVLPIAGWKSLIKPEKSS